jgi:hypothetical protein
LTRRDWRGKLKRRDGRRCCNTPAKRIRRRLRSLSPFLGALLGFDPTQNERPRFAYDACRWLCWPEGLDIAGDAFSETKHLA